MKNLIKISSSNKLEELKIAGFNTYMIEQLNGENIFVFITTPELIAYITNHFEKSDYIFCNKLCF